MDTVLQQRLRLAHHRGQLTDPQNLAVASQILIALEATLNLAYAVTTQTGGPLLFPLARLQMPALFVAGVTFLLWFRYCQANAHAFAPDRLAFTPGMAVAVWFIPVACLWQPRRATLDLARASGGVNIRLINAWWTAWLTHLLGFPVLLLVCALADYRGSAIPWLALPDTVAAILVLQVIRQITNAQRALLTSR
ncbi:DUF4328 domain-containing protein [Kitasatospora sp. RB6PN24]|uniref:DUF4328 domain-containing protein n=1 Tax=Kitasatospora humi TaxID=2893891 RepID=UPI001E65DD7F|nr:DUF4328 domain-containing protein [Kitasatospora humi]MCC9312439.1 DUF4328 domain-containing protein [Kitasatospora humi]